MICDMPNKRFQETPLRSAPELNRCRRLHADYQGKVAAYSILDGALLAGELPPNKHKLVVAWIGEQ